MKVQCPVCQTEYDLEPGKYKCTCGVKFFVLSDGRVSLSDPADMAAKGNLATDADPERTMAPSTPHGKIDSPESAYDPERTVPNIRIRHERGDLQVGEVVLGRYELLEKIGSGAMGVVFKCRDQVAGVYYALKMVPPELVRDSNAMEDVRRNFQLVHGLKHPNIASMDFLDRDEYGSYFLVMEYVDGENLSHWINRKWQNGRPDLSEVIHIVKQIASALDYAHSQQVLHRDIKPANVMIDEQGNVKVLDFGLASKVRSTMTALSVTTANTSGTPHYLSPEQFKGKYPGPAADQYALGVLTYQMFAGHLPFEAEDVNILCRAVLQEEPERPDGLPDPVWDALRKTLSKDPKERFGNCTEFAVKLRDSWNTPMLKLEPVGAPATAGIRNLNRMKAFVAFFAVCVCILLLAFLIFMLEKHGVTRLFSSFSDDGKILQRVPDFVVSYSIPSKVTHIDKGAFYKCESLETVTIPSNVTYIGMGAFRHCKALKRVTIPPSVTSLEDGVFYDCVSLTSVTISFSVTSIGESAFSGCSSLKNVTIPPSVTRIGKEAFHCCSSLTSVVIPSSVTSIGERAFSGCSSLKNVTIPPSVTSLEDGVFYCCNLTSVMIPDSVTRIGHWTFASCQSLTDVTIPTSVTSIGERAFCWCDSLTRVTIPPSVTSIGNYAFSKAGCENQVKRDYPHLFSSRLKK